MALILKGVNIPPSHLPHWDFVKKQLLWGPLAQSLILALGTVACSGLLAIAGLWAVEHFRGPRAMVWEMLLLTPLAFPPYVYATVYLGLAEGHLWAINLRGLGGAIFILSLAFFPYIFIPLRVALRGRFQGAYQAALSLGRPPLRAWGEVLLARGKTSLAIGGVLVGMESLSEFGAVSVLGVETLARSVYTSWTTFFSLEITARLGGALLLLALPLALAEWAIKNKSEPSPRRGEISLPQGPGAVAVVLGILFFSLLLPLGQLLQWATLVSWPGSSILPLLGKGLLVAVPGALVIVLVALALVAMARAQGPRKRGLAEASLLGYALPGNLVAMGILSLTPLVGMAPLGAGLLVKFLRCGYKKLEAGDNTISQGLERASLSLGVGWGGFFWRTYLPLLRPFLLYTTFSLGLELLKELPLTLILRPMGLDTLATKIFELASEGEWEETAPYILSLVAMGMALYMPLAPAFLGRKKRVWPAL